MNLVTGATGLLGSYIVEKLAAAGQPVCALVRANSNTDFLDRLPVEKRIANLAEMNSLQSICRDVEAVYHCAAQVGDYGRWHEFQANTVQAAIHIATAALGAGVRRFVHISSVSVYGQSDRPSLILTEEQPLAQRVPRWFYYTRAKVAAEEHLWRMYNQQGLPLTVIRPAWIYGPRDRHRLPRLYDALKSSRYRIIGAGQNSLNAVYSGNVADACLLAAGNPAAIGQAYNISRDGCIRQMDFFAKLARELHCPVPDAHIPYRLAQSVGLGCEAISHLVRSTRPPLISRYAVWWLGQEVSFPTDKAHEQLGWSPAVTYDEGIRRTAEWYLSFQNKGI